MIEVKKESDQNEYGIESEKKTEKLQTGNAELHQKCNFSALVPYFLRRSRKQTSTT